MTLNLNLTSKYVHLIFNCLENDTSTLRKKAIRSYLQLIFFVLLHTAKVNEPAVLIRPFVALYFFRDFRRFLVALASFSYE